MNTTIYDVAKKAKVSKSTVSRVINNNPNISENTRNKVLGIIEELNYTPSTIARSLSNSSFDAITVIYTRSIKTTLMNPYFSDILTYIGIVSEKKDFDLLIHFSKEEDLEINNTLKNIKNKLPKGIILLSSPKDDSLLVEIDKLNIPTVVIGKVFKEFKNIYTVDTDNFNDCKLLTEHLIKLNHQKIACIHSPLTHIVAQERLDGFLDACKKNNINLEKDYIINGGYNNEDENLRKKIKKLLKSKNHPTAIFATDDLKALLIYQIAKECNLKIPNDLSIIGHNNFSFSALITPSLTTVDVPIKDLGTIGAELLFALIEKKESKKRIILETKLIIRESVSKI